MTAPGPPLALPALGTTAMVADPDGDATATARAVAAPDAACRQFRDDQELAKLTAAGAATIKASPVLLDALTAASHSARLTDGVVDLGADGDPHCRLAAQALI